MMTKTTAPEGFTETTVPDSTMPSRRARREGIVFGLALGLLRGR